MERTGKDSITIETLFSASVERVWDAWTNPDSISNWFGSDPRGKVLEASLDTRPGGKFEIHFRDGDQTEHTCFGAYVTVEEYNKLSFSWEWKSEPGVESFVELFLSPENNFTRMHFVHAHLGNASAHDYLNGWKATFLKLEQTLGNQEIQ